MSKFNEDGFTYDGMYLMYDHTGCGVSHFIARFKRGGMADFKRFLVKNFSVEEYIEQINNKVPPLKILGAKGYVSPQVKRLLKQVGYTPDQAGYQAYLAAAVARYAA